MQTLLVVVPCYIYFQSYTRHLLPFYTPIDDFAAFIRLSCISPRRSRVEQLKRAYLTYFRDTRTRREENVASSHSQHVCLQSLSLLREKHLKPVEY